TTTGEVMSRAIVTLLLGFSFAASAGTFTVTNTNDSGAGSLRDAVTQANNAPGADAVIVNVSGTIVLTSGQIRIDAPLAIVGPGASNLTIDGNANGRIFAINDANAPACPALTGPADGLVSISGMTLRNGSRNVVDSGGGAIASTKSLTLDAVVIRDSVGKNGGGVVFNAQYPGQALTISNSQFIGNTARPVVPGNTGAFRGGGLLAKDNCSGARVAATVIIDRSIFSGNRVQPAAGLEGMGGGIALELHGPVVIQDSRIIDNHADSSPLSLDAGYNSGGIGGYAQSLTIRRSEISGNSADFVGALGAFNTFPGLPAMQLAVVDSTISGNVAHQSVGAVVLDGNVAATISNSTIAGNVANWLNHDENRVSGIGLVSEPFDPPATGNATPPTLLLVSSIVAGGTAASPDIGVIGTLVPVPFSVTASNSLVQAAGPGVVLNGTANIAGPDPMLAALAFNGGPTQTQALLPGSPAIDAGSNTLNLTTDQRGGSFARVVGAKADMGAYETGNAPVVLVVEYYNASLDHYFITYVPGEIATLDAGIAIKGWVRTGYTFTAYRTAQAGTSPVCRFYIPPASGDSHFFGRGTAECDATGQRNPTFVLEDPAFMHMFLPLAGTCPAGTRPIYRVFSNRPDANHRYMTDGAVRDAMVATGWLAEGDGPDLVVMCAP
ncbi:MAG: choice-of-anchor Q domain-containing protein, partial [Casimicrobiaceae bacterium]